MVDHNRHANGQHDRQHHTKEPEQKAFAHKQVANGAAAQADGAQGTDFDRALGHGHAHGVAQHEQNNSTNQCRDKAKNNVEHLDGLPVKRVELLKSAHAELLVGVGFGEYLRDARLRLRQVSGVFELHNDRRHPRRAAAVDQPLRLPKVQCDKDVVELFGALLLGFDDLQAGHVGGTPRGGSQQLDLDGACRRGWRLRLLCGQGGNVIRGCVVGCRRRARSGWYGGTTGTVVYLQRPTELQHPRHAKTNHRRIG